MYCSIMYFSLYIILIIFLQTSTTKTLIKSLFYIKKPYKNTNISYKTYDIVRNLINLNHKTLLKNLF